MVVVLAGADTEVKQSATSEKAALRRALQACVCSDGPTRLVPALKMAESLVRDLDPKTGPEIHLFSDGAVPELNEFENKALPLVYHRVGKGANNLGITALDVRANPEDARQRAIYASVANFSTEQPADRPGAAARRPPAGNAPAHHPGRAKPRPRSSWPSNRATACSPSA